MSELGKKCFACEEEGKSGVMVFKEGTSKAGKPYMGWFCKKNKEHVEWLKERPEPKPEPLPITTSDAPLSFTSDRDYSFAQSYAKDIIVARIEKGYYDLKHNLELALDYARLIAACVEFKELTTPSKEPTAEETSPF